MSTQAQESPAPAPAIETVASAPEPCHTVSVSSVMFSFEMNTEPAV